MLVRPQENTSLKILVFANIRIRIFLIRNDFTNEMDAILATDMYLNKENLPCSFTLI